MNYEKAYFYLFNAITDIIKELEGFQVEAEQKVMTEPEPKIISLIDFKNEQGGDFID